MPTSFSIHPRLQEDCHWLLALEYSELLLHRNAVLPWFILVPRTDAGELHNLERTVRIGVMDEADAVARFVLAWFRCDRINRASIGNVVPQLHLHVIGRYRDDPWWPGVVWGRLDARAGYDDDRLAAVATAVRAHLG